MNATLLNNNTIDKVISSYQSSEKAIIEGSDEHLDIICNVKEALLSMTASTKILVDAIEASFNSFHEDDAKDALVRIFPLFRLAHQMIRHVRKSFVHKDVKKHLDNFVIEVNDLKELVSDLSRYKLQKNEELIALFNEEK